MGSHDFSRKIGINWLQTLLSVFYTEWKSNNYFKDKIKKLLWKSFNKKLPDFLQEIIIRNFTIKGDPPIFKEIIPQKSESFEFLADVDIQFTGSILIEITTALHWNWPKRDFKIVPIRASIEIKQLIARIRLCFVPRNKGKSWFSFVGEPAIFIDIDPTIGERSNFHINNIPKVSSIIKEVII